MKNHHFLSRRTVLVAPSLLIALASSACSGSTNAPPDTGPIEDSGALTDSSAMRDSAVRDSAMRDSAVRDSAMRDSAMRDSAVRDSAMRDSAVRDGGRADGCVPVGGGGSDPGLLFQEDFDDLADWMTETSDSVGPLPGRFDYGYTGETWHPTSVPGSMPSVSISGADPSQVFCGTGKALIVTYESTNNASAYTSDGFLTKNIPPSNEVYVSFRMKFEPGFNAESANGALKILRILSWDGVRPRSRFFSSGNSAPIYLFDWSRSNYGVRQKHAFRCDDQATTYFCTDPRITNAPRSVNNGDMSANFSSDIAMLSPRLSDLVNGGVLPNAGTVWHEQVYGDIWHKLEFYVKLNSAPSVNDGIFRFTLDDEMIIDMDEIPWIGRNGSMDARWNSVAFGGNGKYNWNSSGGFDASRERWIAIDNIVIRNSLP